MMYENISSIILIREIQGIEEKILNQELKVQDITLTQAKALSTLSQQTKKQATLKELEKELGLAQSVTAGIVIRLEQKNYVECFGDAADKRIKIVQITPLGEQRYHVSQKVLGEQEEETLSALTASEKEQFRMLLVKVKNALQELE